MWLPGAWKAFRERERAANGYRVPVGNVGNGLDPSVGMITQL